MLKILGFDTSTEMCSVALLMGSEVLVRQQLAPQKQAELLLPMVDSLLAEAELSLVDLDALAFGQGPGSFMGLRVGTGVVQGLAYGADKPVVAVSSLQTLAQTTYREFGSTQVAAGIDARLHAIYWGVYHLNEDKLMQPLQNDILSKPAEIKLNKDESLVAAGGAWQQYAPELNVVFATNYTELYPLASALVEIAAYKFKRHEIIAAEKAEPYYIRDQVV